MSANAVQERLDTAMAYLEDGEFERAWKEYGKARERMADLHRRADDPDDVIYYIYMSLDDTAKRARRALEEARDDDFEEAFDRTLTLAYEILEDARLARSAED